MRRLVGLVALLAACSQPRAGGPCTYEQFDEACELIGEPSIVAGGDGGLVRVEAQFRAPRRFSYGEVPAGWDVPAAEVEAAIAALKSVPSRPCHGTLRTKGSCAPGEVIVVLPPFAVK